MKVTKIIGEQSLPVQVVKVYTGEELQQEYNYVVAQNMLKLLLDNGLISADEFNKISELNRKTFSPYLADIMI